MSSPLIAIVGDITASRQLDPPLKDPAKAKKAAEQLGTALAESGAKLLVYGGPFLEAEVVRGYVASGPKEDKSILMWYSEDNKPPAFPEEASHPRLFERKSERGADWEVAFYRGVTKADGIILMGGGNAAKISGLIAIGIKLPIIALPEFGGGTKKVWETLSVGEDLPSRDDIDLMAKEWSDEMAAACVKSLTKQRNKKQLDEGTPKLIIPILGGLFFLAALAIVPWIWGHNQINVWMLFIVPMIAGGAGAAIRTMVDRQKKSGQVGAAILVNIVLGLVAGGVAGILFVTAQLTANPDLIKEASQYASRSIPYAFGVGFIAGLTSETVFGKLLGIDVIRVSGIDATQTKT